MAINFKRIAKQQTILSEVIETRTKLEKVDGEYHICDFDIVPDGKGEVYAVCAVNDAQYINGGKVLTDIFTAIVKEFDGNIDNAREEFKQAGGLDVILTRKKTKSGHDLVTVEIL